MEGKGFFLISLLAWLSYYCNAEPHYAQLSSNTDIETKLNGPENKDNLKFMAVFLLSTLEGALAFGAGADPRRDFFARVKASKLTWGHPLPHFYSVVGNNDANKNILKNPKHCTDLTHHYHHSVKHVVSEPKEEVYECSGVKVLYLPFCDSSSWGPKVKKIITPNIFYTYRRCRH